MTCTGCRERAPVHQPVWDDNCDRELIREHGWFMWSRRAPVEFHGCVLCPSCQPLNRELMKKAGPPDLK